MKNKVLIYCRISEDRTGKEAGVQRQEQECRVLADTLGWSVADVLVDNDISAYSGKVRPEYQALLAELRAGRANGVIAWHPDRLYRRLVDLEEFIDVVNGHGIAVRTVQAGEVDLATPTGRAMARTHAVWAGHEVEHGIERMRSAKKQAAIDGKFLGGGRPFGYEPGGLVPRESEAVELRDATRRVLASEALWSVAQDWNKRRILTARGGKWSITSVRSVLIRARNAGLVERKGEIVGPAAWPAVVPEHEVMAVRTLVTDPSRLSTTTRDRRHLGAGLYLCGRCNDGTTVRTGATGGPKGNPTYRCRAKTHLSRAVSQVDEYVFEVMDQLLVRPEMKLRLFAASEADVTALQAEATAVRIELDGLRQALGEGEIDLRTFKIAATGMRGRLSEVEGRLKAMASRSPLSGIVDAEDVSAAWAAASLSRRRAAIDAVVTVTLLPAPRGRRPGGVYFDSDSVLIEPRE